MSTPASTLARFQDIEACLAEANSISKKPKLTRQDETRVHVLLARVAALKAGFTPEQARSLELNTSIPAARFTREQVTEARDWQQFIQRGTVEQRVGEVGSGQLIGLTTPGSFVPIQFFERLSAALKQHDPVFDPELVSYVETERGGLLQAPVVSDLGNVAEPVTESSASGYADLTSTGHAQSTPHAYRTPLWKVSLEAEQDLEAFIPTQQLAEYFFTDRVARGVGRDIINGDGTGGRILGVIRQLIAAGVNPVTAIGSSSNTGGSETGTNSIGTKDLAKVYTSVDQAYRKSSKAAWLMNDDTLNYLLGLVDKMGRPIVRVSEGLPYIFSKPVLISPSLDSIGASKTPVLFGDWRYLLVHCAKQGQYVKRYWQAPGFVEQGIVGLRAFVRYDAQLLWNDASNSSSPIARLQNAS